MSDKKGRPEKYTVAQVSQAIEHSEGFISKAIDFLSVGQKTRCSPDTFKRYLAKYPELADLKAYYREKLVDLAEIGLMGRILKGDTLAMIYVTKNLGKDRGWADRIELTGAGGSPIKVLHLPVEARTVEEWTTICQPRQTLPKPPEAESSETKP